jgi:DNA-binding GntR family transcriptional regulator
VIKDDRLHQHRAVLEAIEAGAPEAARERMAVLLQDSIDDVRRALVKRRAATNGRRTHELA